MLKRITSIMLVVIVLLSAFVIFPATTAGAASHKDNIINSLIEMDEYWYSKSYFADKGYYGYGTGEFIDIDYDGNLEFVLTYPCSDYRDVYREIICYKDGELQYIPGGDNSGYGYGGMNLKAYYTPNVGGFKFFDSTMLYENKNAWIQQNFTMHMGPSSLNVEYFSGKIYLDGEYTYFGKSNGYADLDGAKEVSSKKYKSINSNQKSGLIDAGMTTKKIDMKKWYSYSDSKKKTLLTESYNAFKFKSTILSAPALPTFEARGNCVILNWKEVKGAKGYRVYRKTASSGWKSLGNTNDNRFEDFTAKQGNKYTYTVRCTNANGAYVISSYNKTGKTFNYLKTPEITKLGSAKDGVKITWGKVSGAENYRVYVKSNGKWKTIGNTTSTSFVHKGTKSNQTYSYTIRCTTKSGKTFTSMYNNTGWSIKYIGSPVIKKVENTTDGVKVSWNAVSGAENYRLYFKGGEYKSWTKVADTTATSLTHTTAKSGVKYTYTVACMSPDSSERISSFDSKGKAITFIASPVITKTQETSKGIKLTWDKVNGAAKYRVFVKSGSSWKKLKDTTSTSYTHTGLKANTEYTYTVRCISSTGKSYTSAYNKTGWTVGYKITPPPTQAPTVEPTTATDGVTESVAQTTAPSELVLEVSE